MNNSASPAPSQARPALAGEVVRALFTTGIAQREPVDDITRLGNNVGLVYFFTEVKNMAGQTVTHRWELNGKVMSEIKFDVGGTPWRVYSNKKLQPAWLGEWKASLIDPRGGTLVADTFSYVQAARPGNTGK